MASILITVPGGSTFMVTGNDTVGCTGSEVLYLKVAWYTPSSMPSAAALKCTVTACWLSAARLPVAGSTVSQVTPAAELPLARIIQLPAKPSESIVPHVLSGGKAGGAGGSVFHQPIHERPWLAVWSMLAGHCAGVTALVTQRLMAPIRTSPAPPSSSGVVRV